MLRQWSLKDLASDPGPHRPTSHVWLRPLPHLCQAASIPYKLRTRRLRHKVTARACGIMYNVEQGTYWTLGFQVCSRIFLKKIVYLLLAELGLCCCSWVFSSCSEWATLLLCVGFSLLWLLLSWSMNTAPAVAPMSCGIFLDQAANPRLLH